MSTALLYVQFSIVPRHTMKDAPDVLMMHVTATLHADNTVRTSGIVGVSGSDTRPHIVMTRQAVRQCRHESMRTTTIKETDIPIIQNFLIETVRDCLIEGSPALRHGTTVAVLFESQHGNQLILDRVGELESTYKSREHLHFYTPMIQTTRDQLTVDDQFNRARGMLNWPEPLLLTPRTV